MNAKGLAGFLCIAIGLASAGVRALADQAADASAHSSTPGTAATSGSTQAQKCINAGAGELDPTLILHTRVRILPAMPSGGPTERPHSKPLAIVPMTGAEVDSGKAVFIRTDDTGTCALSLPPGRYWIGPPEQISSGARAAERPGPFVTEGKVVNVGAAAQTVILYTTGALP